MKFFSDTIYTLIGLFLVISIGITFIGLIAYILGVPPERILPILTVTTLIMVLCTLVGLWKKQVFAAAFGWIIPGL